MVNAFDSSAEYPKIAHGARCCTNASSSFTFFSLPGMVAVPPEQATIASYVFHVGMKFTLCFVIFL